MNLAINVLYNPSGGSFSQLVNMIKYFSKRREINLYIYTTKNNLYLFDNFENKNIKIIVSKFAGFSRFNRVLWEQTIFPIILYFAKIDLLFCPGNIAPIFSPVKSIVWIGTIGPFLKSFIKYFSTKERFELYINKYVMIASARSANAVIFESNYTKELFLNNYGIDKKKSHVINIGKDEYYIKSNIKSENDLHDKYELFEPYALCVSHLYPYKNILNMLSAFSAAQKQTGNQYKLLIAGGIKDIKYHKEILSQINYYSLQDSVFLLNSVTKKELMYLYKRCEFFIFPSPFENFAYTLVEAMSCGAPIICSDTTAMPETCKDAALYINPYNIDEMTDKINLIISNKELRFLLREKSINRSIDLPDYQEVTFQTLDIIKNIIHKHT